MGADCRASHRVLFVRINLKCPLTVAESDGPICFLPQKHTHRHRKIKIQRTLARVVSQNLLLHLISIKRKNFLDENA